MIALSDLRVFRPGPIGFGEWDGLAVQPVQYLQGFSGACWFFVAVSLARPTWRSLFGKPHDHDPLWSAFFFMGVLQSGFVLRWALYPKTLTLMSPAELNLWTALYALCGLLALWVLKVAGAYRGKQF